MSLGDAWHLAVNGDKSGPHTLAELRRKLETVELGVADVRVWAPGMADWVDPQTVPGLIEKGDEGSGVFGASGGVGNEEMSSAAVNPYATPQTVDVASEPAVVGEPGNHVLDIGLCLSEGWRLTLKNFGRLILFGIVYFVISIALSLLITGIDAALGAAGGFEAGDPGSEGGAPELSAGAILISVLLQIAQNLISIFLGIGVAIFGLKIVRSENPEISNLFAGGPYFWSVLLATILFFLMVIVGLALLIVPGIFLAARFGQFQWAIIDQNLGPIDGLKASWEMTRGNVWRLIGLLFVVIGIVLLGALALIVGLILAYPLVFLVMVLAFQVMRYGADSLEREGATS
ncbi:MAG: GYF domain-containing protein [Verrucomicrobiota bacterium]